jgi:hypothetical protein
MIQDQNIDRLKAAIEASVDRKMRTPKDFDYLSEQIFKSVHQTISPTTLKRLWGYLSETTVQRPSTLNILSQFVGYDSWDAFCQNEDSTEEQEIIVDSSPDSTSKHRRPGLWIVLALLAAVAVIAFSWSVFRRPSPASEAYTLKIGDRFDSYTDYLKLFGINDSDTYWGRVLPHHPHIVLWGPEYHHPSWHNEGSKDSMMPTITEHWEPASADSQMVIMRNRDKYHHELRLNEIRITFMKNLVDTNYVFLGVYRLSLQQSDTIRCVWERVAEECDLNHLEYLEELRN